MDTTPNLRLPYIAAAQAQKHVTHNEAIRALDAIVQLSVTSRTTDASGLAPENGTRFIVPASAEGAWTGGQDRIAAFQDGAWAFFEPQIGWLAWIADENKLVAWDGGQWIAAGGGDVSSNPIEGGLVGINATADSTNKLAVKSDALLFSHDDVTPGTGDMRQVLNKAAPGGTVSQLYQSNWSGHAETGLTGDDDFHLKVSPDGATWHNALVADKDDGSVALPNGQRHAISGALLRSQIFTPGGANISTIWRFDEQRTGFPRTATIDAVAGDTLTLADGSRYGNDPTTGVPIVSGTGPLANKTFFRDVMEGLSFLRLWNTSKSPAQTCWIAAAPGASDLRVTDSTHIATWLPGETVQLGEPDLNNARVVAVDISQFLRLHTGAVFPQAGLALVAGISAQGTGGWFGHIGVTPDASGGSFANVSSATADHNAGFTAGLGAGGGFINAQVQVGTTVLSPISNSNLVFVREYDDGAGSLRIGALTAVGVWV